MRALDIQQSLVIHCLYIYDITGFLEEWGKKKKSGDILWNVKILSTP